jgi:hypothetical protein
MFVKLNLIFWVLSLILIIYCIIYIKRKPENGEKRKLPSYIKNILVVFGAIHLIFAILNFDKMIISLKEYRMIKENVKRQKETQRLAKEFKNWLDDRTKMVVEIGEIFVNINDKQIIENESNRFINEGLYDNVESIWIGFSDDTEIDTDKWEYPENENWFIDDTPVSESGWYINGIKANGKTIAVGLFAFEDYYSMVLSEKFAIVKNIGIIDGVNAVLGVKLIIPEIYVKASTYWDREDLFDKK